MLSVKNFLKILASLSLLGALSVPALTQAAGPSRSTAATDILVTTPGYDDIGEVLETQFGWMQGTDWTEITPDDLGDYTLLDAANTIFINCAFSIPPVLPTDNLRRFVAEGGTLYTSDWAYEYVAAAFPGYIQFAGDDPALGAAGTITATVTDGGLRNYLFGVAVTTILPLHYDLSSWVVITDVLRVDVTVLLRGDVVLWDYDLDDYRTVPGLPLAVTFPYGQGKVVYTTFHNEAQQSDLEKRLLEYLVLLPTTTALQQQTQQALTAAGFTQVRQDLNLVDPGMEVEGGYAVADGKGIAFALSWAGSTLRLEVYRPDGSLYSQKEAGVSPLLIAVPAGDAVNGAWSYRVTAVDVPSQNYPIAVGIGKQATQTYLPILIR